MERKTEGWEKEKDRGIGERERQRDWRKRKTRGLEKEKDKGIGERERRIECKREKEGEIKKEKMIMRQKQREERQGALKLFTAASKKCSE